jgi:hypothetical protein
MKNSIVLSFFLFLVYSSAAQQAPIPQDYFDRIKEAESLFAAKKYALSAQRYTEAFKAGFWKGYLPDRYHAAQAWAMSGSPDSAFFQLERIVSKLHYADYEEIANDANFKSLHTDPRWLPLLEKVHQNEREGGNELNPFAAAPNPADPLAMQLDQIYQQNLQNQRIREEVANKYGEGSIEMARHKELMALLQQSQLLQVKTILDQYGWVGKSRVGERGMTVLFEAIQHADLVTQEHYLPSLRVALKEGNARAGELSLLEDKVAMAKGKRQIYGTLFGRDTESGQFYVMPLEDPDHVDERRAKIGLLPLENYLLHWNIKWDVAQYKKDLPMIEAKSRKN